MRRLIWILGLLVTGGIVLPLAAYLIGTRLAGPFAGTRGFASYLGAILADAAAGRPLALLLILGPLACAFVWTLRGWWWRRYRLAPESE